MTPLQFGTNCYVPREVAECPECGGELTARSMAWEADGVPSAADIDVNCVNDPDCNHRWWQSDWQPVMDAVRKWSKAK